MNTGLVRVEENTDRISHTHTHPRRNNVLTCSVKCLREPKQVADHFHLRHDDKELMNKSLTSTTQYILLLLLISDSSLQNVSLLILHDHDLGLSLHDTQILQRGALPGFSPTRAPLQRP